MQRSGCNIYSRQRETSVCLSLIGLGFSDILGGKPFLTTKTTPDSHLFSSPVEGVARLLSDAAIFNESDFSQRRKVNVVFLELLKYGFSPLKSAWIGFVQHCSYIPYCYVEVVRLLDILILSDACQKKNFCLLKFMLLWKSWQGFIWMYNGFLVVCALLSAPE